MTNFSMEAIKLSLGKYLTPAVNVLNLKGSYSRLTGTILNYRVIG